MQQWSQRNDNSKMNRKHVNSDIQHKAKRWNDGIQSIFDNSTRLPLLLCYLQLDLLSLLMPVNVKRDQDVEPF